LDFGLAKLVGQTRLTKTGSTVGTFAYMSPEQARSEEVDHRSDIWSLGVILYEMVTGELPFKGDYDQAVVYSILNEPPESMEFVPPELREIIEIALAKNSEERYQNVEELITDLKVLKGESDSSQRIISHELQSKRIRHKKLIRYILYPALLLVVLLAGYLSIQTLLSKEIEPVPIAVISFENQTGDPAYDKLRNLIPNLLITDLDQSRFFQVNSWERMKDLLEQIDQGDKKYIEFDEGIQIAKMDNIPAILSGSFAIIGEVFSIDIKVLDTKTKEILKSARSSGKGQNSILESQIDDLSEQIATAIDLPPREFVKSKRSIIDVTTNSLEAYKYYLLGREELDVLNSGEAKNYFTQALLLDSTFAMAHLYLAACYRHVGTKKEIHKHLEMAKKYRSQLTHKEQIILDYDYAWMKGNNVSKSIDVLEKSISLYPKEKQIFRALGGYYWGEKGADAAIPFYMKVLELDPNDKFTLNDIGYAYMAIGDYTNALGYLQRCAALAPNKANVYDSLGDVYLRMNEHTKSIEMYEKAEKLGHGLSHYIGIASNFIKMGTYRKARNHLNQCPNIKYDWWQWAFYELMAITYMAEGDLESTIKEIESIANLAMQNLDTVIYIQNQFKMSEILYENGKLDDAMHKLVTAKNLIENSDLSDEDENNLWEMYLEHSTQLALKIGNINQAKEYAVQYKDYNSNEYFILYGLIAYAEENYEKAITDLKQSDLNSPFSNYHLALAYQKNGDKTQAIEKLENAIKYYGRVNIFKEIARQQAEKQLAILKAGN